MANSLGADVTTRASGEEGEYFNSVCVSVVFCEVDVEDGSFSAGKLKHNGSGLQMSSLINIVG